MTCSRCEGMMLAEHLLDMEATYSEMWAKSWRCVNCGHRDDAIIRGHRHRAALKAVPSVVAAESEVVQEIWDEESVEELAA